MALWALRYAARMIGYFMLMLLVEFAAFMLYRDHGINRLLWVPVSFGVVAFAGYDTVKRLPLIWGALIGALLAGATSFLSWMIGSFVAVGRFRMPPEAEPLLLGTTLLTASIVGAIVGVSAGMLARARRRQRSRRSAIKKLAYMAVDEPPDLPVESSESDSAPLLMHDTRRPEQ